MASYINDGYTLKATIPARAPYPDLKFSYRPALDEDYGEYVAKAQGKTGKAATEAKAAFIAKHLVSWDVTDAKGAEVAIDAASVRKLPPVVIGAILDYIVGYAVDAQDEDAKN